MTANRAGDEFGYSNSGYELLGTVIEQIRGRPIAITFSASSTGWR
jgi:CubicO group peptidase (beta-lactamase class C family)